MTYKSKKQVFFINKKRTIPQIFPKSHFDKNYVCMYVCICTYVQI
jgi:hypothetical protein